MTSPLNKKNFIRLSVAARALIQWQKSKNSASKQAVNGMGVLGNLADAERGGKGIQNILKQKVDWEWFRNQLHGVIGMRSGDSCETGNGDWKLL